MEIEIVAFIIFGLAAVMFFYVMVIHPFTKAGQAARKKYEKEKEEERMRLVNEYGVENVTAMENNMVIIGMPSNLVLQSFGNPGDIRNKVIEKEKRSEEWHYYPILDLNQQPQRDSEGEIKYSVQIFFENGIITRIVQP